MNIKEMIYNEILAAYTKVMTNVIEARPVVEIKAVKDALAGQPHAIQAIKRSHSAPQVAPKIAEVEEEFSRIWTALFEKKSAATGDHLVIRNKAIGEAVEVANFEGCMAQLSEATRKAIADVDRAARAKVADVRAKAEAARDFAEGARSTVRQSRHAAEAFRSAGWAGQEPDPRDATSQRLVHQAQSDGQWAAGWYVDTTAVIDRRPATQAEIDAFKSKG